MATELELTRLNACKDISVVLASLKRPATNCRSATGVIERTIHDFDAGHYVRMCILERPPIASLSDFTCINSSVRDGEQNLVCFRPATAALLSDFKTNYVPKYSARVAAYLKDARICPGSTGDSSRTVDTTFDPMLWVVAKHEFGFNVQFGDTKPGSSMVTHGFARTSPEISKRGPDVIEYVAFTYGMSSASAPEARTSLGNWRLRVDSSSELFVPFQKLLKRQGLDAYIAFVDVNMERAPRASVLSKVPSLPDELSDVVASILEDEGFEEMSDADLQRHTGRTRQKMREALEARVLFGSPQLTNGRVPNIRILLKTSGIPCARGGRGAISAYILGYNGQEGVQVDFGSISTVLAGFGACASAVDSGPEYVRNLVHESKQAILDVLAGR